MPTLSYASTCARLPYRNTGSAAYSVKTWYARANGHLNCSVPIHYKWSAISIYQSVNQFFTLVGPFTTTRFKVDYFFQQEVWPPGLANTACPRPPLMTQVHHFVSRIKKMQRWGVQTMSAYDLDLWPSRSPRLSVIRVRLGTFVRVPSANFVGLGYDPHGSDIPCHLVTLIFNVEGHGACR